MQPAKLWLILTVALFSAWIGYLAYLAYHVRQEAAAGGRAVPGETGGQAVGAGGGGDGDRPHAVEAQALDELVGLLRLAGVLGRVGVAPGLDDGLGVEQQVEQGGGAGLAHGLAHAGRGQEALGEGAGAGLALGGGELGDEGGGGFFGLGEFGRVHRRIRREDGEDQVVAAADEVGGDNNDQPSYVLQNIPPTGELAKDLDEKFASVYFGEGLTGYAAVRTKVAEQNISGGDATVEAPSYEGSASVPV